VVSVTDPYGVFSVARPETRNILNIIFIFDMPLNRMLISLKDVISEIQAALQSRISPTKSREFNAATAVHPILPPPFKTLNSVSILVFHNIQKKKLNSMV
jgi:hypothetical protein